MSSINELRGRGAGALRAAGISDADIDASLLLEHVLGVNKDHILAHGTDAVAEDRSDEYLALIERRKKHVPLQYITGHQEFMGLDFEVNEHVLIPRQDTECLVEEAMIETGDGMRVLDLCTGSGCILISLMRYKNDIEGIGTDISGEALKTAEHNAAANGVNAKFLQGDLFEALNAHPSMKKDRFDIVISNPPYIPSGIIGTLMEEVRDYEPVNALDGGTDGLDFYKRILEGADEYLIPGGCILFEIGYDQGPAVSGLLRDKGYTDISVVRDLAGLDRVVKGRRSIILNMA
ncbi:MAG: peptide chain release factor N(5)-glutamine methyltransferase [Lachnospiraceae bacterium]|nr:peptide chain release factor N(5)-glutamine methyltransferase [Lachnospiraceae bacterium]